MTKIAVVIGLLVSITLEKDWWCSQRHKNTHENKIIQNISIIE